MNDVQNPDSTETLHVVAAVAKTIDEAGVTATYQHDAAATEVMHFFTIPLKSGEGLFICVRNDEEGGFFVVEPRADHGDGERIEGCWTLSAVNADAYTAAVLIRLAFTRVVTSS